MNCKSGNWMVVISGVAIGIGAILLTLAGNPGNMGFCIACFLRDTAGALGLHSTATVQYIRPEIIGLLLGSLFMALAMKEFKPTGGSAPMTRFILGVFVMIGALMFLGCPLRMVLRIGGGDLNAIVGLIGFIVGIAVGTIFLKNGFSLKRTYKLAKADGFIMPAIMVVLLVFLLIAPGFIHFSEEGPGSMRAFWLISLAIGLVIGALCQRSRLCMAGGIRDILVFKDFHLIYGFLAIIVTVIIGNLILGTFNLSFEGQPVAHTDGLWNFLGMALVGWASVLLGGCPLRQLILSGEGNQDSSITVIGMIVGAALCHNFGLASSTEGPTANGMVAVGIGFVVCLVVSLCNLQKEA